MMHRRQFVASAIALGMVTAAAPAWADDTAASVVQDYVAAWNAHDAEKAAAQFADDVVYYDASVGTPITGRDAAKRGVIESFLNAAPDAKWTIKGDPLVAGERVSFEWEFAGTNTGAWGDGTPATGKAFKFAGASMFTVKAGKIATQNDYYDALGFFKQLGLM